MKLKPRHKWFCASDMDADRWEGPFDSIEEAITEGSCGGDDYPIYIAQGRKLKKAEIEEMAVDYDWEVESSTAFEVNLTPTVVKETK